MRGSSLSPGHWCVAAWWVGSSTIQGFLLCAAKGNSSPEEHVVSRVNALQIAGLEQGQSAVPVQQNHHSAVYSI